MMILYQENMDDQKNKHTYMNYTLENHHEHGNSKSGVQ